MKDYFKRQIALPEVGVSGQKNLESARVLIIGLGGLGTPAALYLARSGVGTLGLMDPDLVTESNLHRQILYSMTDVGLKKVEVAKRVLERDHPWIKIQCVPDAFNEQNARQTIANYDVVIDGTDRFDAKYLIHDACYFEKKPLVQASLFRFEAQASTFIPGQEGCYRCLFPKPPSKAEVPNCEDAGVLGVLPGIMGAIQATEAIKVILGIGEVLSSRLIIVDALSMEINTYPIKPYPHCRLCGTETLESNKIKDAILIEKETGFELNASMDIDAKTLAQELKSSTPPKLIDVRTQDEREICTLEGSTHIPIDELAARYSELNPAENYVVYCKMGGRSAKGVKILKNAGFKNVRNLNGGIIGWIEDVDPSLESY